MRLAPEEVDAITASAREAFGYDVVVRLFGSRVDDSARGGDIDLLIEADPARTGIRDESFFLSRLFDRIDERRVDIVLVGRGVPLPSFAAHVRPASVALT